MVAEERSTTLFGLSDAKVRRFKGYMKSRQPHGWGQLVSHDGTRIYSGSWAEGQKHGFGHLSTIVKGIRKVVTGDWYHGLQHGYGITQFYEVPPGGQPQHDQEPYMVLEGFFLFGKLQGWGRMKRPDEFFEGFWLRGQRHGAGWAEYSNGDRFCGTWHHNRRHGPGCYTSAKTGQALHGIWKEDALVSAELLTRCPA